MVLVWVSPAVRLFVKWNEEDEEEENLCSRCSAFLKMRRLRLKSSSCRWTRIWMWKKRDLKFSLHESTFRHCEDVTVKFVFTDAEFFLCSRRLVFGIFSVCSWLQTSDPVNRGYSLVSIAAVSGAHVCYFSAEPRRVDGSRPAVGKHSIYTCRTPLQLLLLMESRLFVWM